MLFVMYTLKKLLLMKHKIYCLLCGENAVKIVHLQCYCIERSCVSPIMGRMRMFIKN